MTDLPDMFTFEDGRKVMSPADWRNRRIELIELIQQIEYGFIPPAPAHVHGEELGHQSLPALGGYKRCFRLVTGSQPTLQFHLDIYLPPGAGPFPVILNGDGCWPILTDDIRRDVLQRGYLLAVFDRCEIVPDAACPKRDCGLYATYPDLDFGALAAWAWGYQRCVDFLIGLEIVKKEQIAITGHSRGGKCVLLAGATDERIALTAPNNSGCGGAGSYYWQGEKSETMADILHNFPYWFCPRLQDYLGHEDQLPFDQHSLKALVAPRAFLSTEALGDLWANPTGTWQTHRAAQEVYRYLGVADQIGAWYRPGGHDHGRKDWATLLDFADWRFRQVQPTQNFNDNPFPDLMSHSAWSIPE